MTAVLSRVPSLVRHNAPVYEISGPRHAPVVLALGGISATPHVVRTERDASPGWWDAIGGAARPLDTTRKRVLSVDFLDGGVAADGQAAAVVTTVDQAANIVACLNDLGINRLDAVIGASYGGMVALALAQHWPERVRQLVVISAGHESHPMATGLRAVQRHVVRLGLETGRHTDAMILARAIAMTTYRTAAEFSERFHLDAAHRNGEVEFDVERYLLASGVRFAHHMPPSRFLALSLSADLHRASPENVTVPTTVIAAQGDTLVPPALLRAMAKRLPRLHAFHLLRTRFGHDAFLTEPDRLCLLLASALKD